VILWRSRSETGKKETSRHINIMGNVFGKEKPLKEIIRENQRMLKKAIRELEREIGNLQKNETKLVNDIKKMAKEGQMVIEVSVMCL
jgi:hypothetical protein